MKETICVIRLEKETRDRLKEFGKKGDTYDDIMVQLMDEAERREKR